MNESVELRIPDLEFHGVFLSAGPSEHNALCVFGRTRDQQHQISILQFPIYHFLQVLRNIELVLIFGFI